MKKSFVGLILLCRSLMALPEAPRVVSGHAVFSETDLQTMEIEAQDRTIINYETFNIASLERVQFLQKSSSSTVLNRVVGQDPSHIFGKISSNGKVFLVNPNGVYFGPGSHVDTGSLIVSTLSIADQDFLEDRFSFCANKGGGLIHNEGTLEASSGIIALISPQVKNEGMINAALGKVLLASGEAVTLTFEGDELMSFEIEEGAHEALIEHLGSIQSLDNEVFIQLSLAKEAIRNVINLEGLVEGNVLTQEKGTVRIAHQSSIKAKNVFIEADAPVTVEGNIDVSNVAFQKVGGRVQILGDHIELLGAAIDASGDSGGGTVLIGGEYKGEGPFRNALTNFMDEASIIKANALNEGDGGRVIVWADDTTFFNGTIFAQGGKFSGNGGFVETSGKERLGVYTGHVNTLSSYGKAGTWLLDPLSITIDSSGGGSLAGAALCTDTTTNLTIAPATINAAAANVVLCASSTITQNLGQNIAMTNPNIGITFRSNTGTIATSLNGSITTIGGAVAFTGATITLAGTTSIDTTNGGGNPGANITFGGAINGAQSLTIAAGTAGIISFAVIGNTAPPTSVVMSNAASISIGNTITVSGATALTFPSPVVLVTNTVIKTTNNNVSFNNTLNGAFLLQLTAGTGTITFSGAIGGSAPPTTLTISGATITQSSTAQLATALTYTGSTAINVQGNITIAGGPITFTGPVVLTNNNTFDTTNGGGNPGGGAVSFSSTLNGAVSTAFRMGSGTFSISGIVGGSAPPTNLTFISGTEVQIGSNWFLSGANPLIFGIPVNNTGLATVTSNNANIQFNSVLNGAHTITLAAGTGNVIFNAAVGGTAPLVRVNVSSATQIQIAANFTVTGASPMSFSSPVLLTGASTITSNNATITFGSTLDGALALSVASGTATTTFTGAVGSITPLSSLTMLSSAALLFSNTVNIAGALAQSAAATGATTFSNTVSVGSATLSGTTFAVNNSFTATGAVGVTNSGLFTKNATGSISAAGGFTTSGNVSLANNITTTNTALTIGGTLTLAASASPTLTSGTGPLTITGTSDGTAGGAGETLTLNASGGIISLGALGSGSATRLTAVTVTNSAAITFNGAINITGALTQTNAATGATTFSNTVSVGSATLRGTTYAVNNSFTATGAIAVTNSGAFTLTSIGAITAPGGFSLTGDASLSNNITTTNTTLSIGGNLSLGAAVTLSTQGAVGAGNISITGTTDGAQILTLTAGTGTVAFTGAVGGNNPPLNLNFVSAGLIQIGANITVSGAHPLTFPSSVSLTGTSTITSNNANISFSTTLDGANTLTIQGGTGTTTFTGAIGGTTALSSLSATSATITQSSTATTTGALSYTGSTAINVKGNITTNSGAITLTGPVTLTGALVFNTTNSGTGGTISFFGSTSILNWAVGNTLTFKAGTTGDVSFGGTVGGSIAPTNLIFTSSAGILIAANITVSGAFTLNFAQAVTLTGTSNITSNNANITFSSTLDGAEALTLTAGTGTVAFLGAVGGTAPLTNITFASAALIQVGANITVSGANTLTFPDPVSLTGTSIITSNNADIGFSTTLNGAQELTLAAGTGTITFTGAIGAATPLASLIATGSTLTQTSTAATTGALSYSGSTVINVDGNITTNGGAITMTGPTVLTGALTFDATNGGGAPAGNNISFSGSASTLNWTVANTLTFEAGTSGDVSFGGAVGGDVAPTNLIFTSANLVQIGANMTVSGAHPLLFSRPVSMTGTSTILSNNANVSFSLTLDGPGALTLTAAAGTVLFTGAVGANTPLASLIASTSATLTQSSSAQTTGALSYTAPAISIEGNITTRGGTITMAGPVSLTNAPIFDSTEGGSDAGGANISFSSTVNGATSLTLGAGTLGSITFTGAVGGATALTNLVFTSAQVIFIGSNVTVTGAHPLIFLDPVSLTGSSTILSNNANITFSSTLDGSHSLVLTAGTGALTFTGAVGGSASLMSLTATCGILTESSSLTASGTVNYTNTGLLTIAGTLSSGAFHQSGGGSVLLEAGLIVRTSILFTNAITFNTSIFMSAGTGITLDSAMIPTEDGVYNLTLLSPGATITAPQLGSPSEYINTLTLSAASIHITSIYANTIINNGSEIIDANITAPGAYLVFQNPTTVADGTFTIDVSGGSSIGGIKFYSTLDGPGGLTFILGGGNIAFEESVGGIIAFGDLTITSAQSATLFGDFTGSSFVQAAGTGTTTVIGTLKTTTSTGVSLTGTIFDLIGPIITIGSGPVSFENAGLLTLSGSISSSGLVSQTGEGSVSLGNTITTTSATAGSASVSFTSAVTLIEDVVINTTAGGGSITFGSSSTIDGLQNFSLIAGSGDISLGGTIGGFTPLNSFTIYSAGDLTLPAITASSLTQAAGTGTTTLGGEVTTTGSSGIVLAGNIFNINASIKTLGTGSITLQNTGQLTISPSSTIIAAGSFIQMGTGTTGLYGNITSDE